MPMLKHTKIYRGGVTANRLSFETRTCSSRVGALEKTLDLEFNIASKGGGSTNIILEIGYDDFPTLLGQIASKIPESAGMLSDSATTAYKQILKDLEEARRVRDDEQARAKSLIEDLEPINEYIYGKYIALPAGEDEKEAEVKDKIENVINSLRHIT